MGTSNYCFTFRNLVKHGGILSPLIFSICTDSLSKQCRRVRCGYFPGALPFAADIALLSRSMGLWQQLYV